MLGGADGELLGGDDGDERAEPLRHRLQVDPGARAARSSEITVDVGAAARAASSSSRIPSSVGPEGAIARIGKPGSTIAIGPCRKSAEDYGAAITPVSSESFSAASNAVP